MNNTRNPSLRPTLRGLVLALAVAGATLALIGTSTADTLLYSEDFDADHTVNWTINNGPGANVADAFFDYSAVGIPSAPHSVGGTTRGLKLVANCNAANQPATGAAGLSASPVGQSFSGDYELRFDMWCNFNGPAPGGSGSTQETGGGIGTSGSTANYVGVANGFWCVGTAEGGTTTDYRVYTPGNQASIQDGSPVYLAGSRNNSAALYTTAFPARACPAAQISLYPQQTGSAPAGSLGWTWHDVSVKKIGTLVTWTIDGTALAIFDMSTNGTAGGGNILLVQSDINATASTDANRTNLIFGLFDNIRVTSLTSVSVSATAPNASEAGPSPGTFTLTRTDTGTPLTVNFTLTGTAVNGVDYTNAAGVAVPTSATFGATDTSVNIDIIPVDDTVAELTETVVLTVTSGAGYHVGSPSSATVQITDNDAVTIDLAPLYSTMYERLTNDHASFKLTRRGDLNAASFDVNLSASGSPGAYQPVGTVTFDPGVVSTILRVHPFDNSTLDGPRSVTISIAPGGYSIGTNDPVTAAIVDDETPPETILWSDNLQTDTSPNWKLLAGSTNSATVNYTTNWAYDYSPDNIPPAPHSGADTHGLKMTVNKTAGGGAAGLNLYPIGPSFSGNYALRFDMYLAVGSPQLFTTELAFFGINHDSLHTNWFKNSGVPAGWTFDGLWCWIESDGAAQYPGGDYRLSGAATGTAPALLAGEYATNRVATFKSPPWADYVNIPPVSGYPGVPANVAGLTTTPCWADVEVSQIGKVVTLTINRTAILSYTNATGPVSGDIMLGYGDPADSVGPPASSVIYANARVISLAAPHITTIVVNGGNAEITFTANAGDVVGQFVLQSASVVNGTYADTNSTITSLGGGAFKAVKAAGASQQFYRIRRIY